eukprot:3659492-Amphidinium_carterae.1
MIFDSKFVPNTALKSSIGNLQQHLQIKQPDNSELWVVTEKFKNRVKNIHADAYPPNRNACNLNSKALEL